MILKKFEANLVGNDYVVGDIHGEWDAVDQALLDVKFDADNDRLFSVGDLVDRGLESERALEWLAKPWFHAVRGNHEQMAIDVFRKRFPAHVLLYNGGSWFLTMSDEEMLSYVDAFESLPYAIEVDTVSQGRIGIVHAEVPDSDWASLSKREVATEDLLWARSRINAGDCSRVVGIDSVYVGHTPTPEVTRLGNVHYIDTGSVFPEGSLTILKIN